MITGKRIPTVSYYPIALNLRNRLAIVIGGGRVAEHKIKKLLGTEARIKVVSPKLTIMLQRFARQGKIVWVPRCVRNTDLAGANIIIAATSDPSVNKLVSVWGHKQGALVNVVDKAGISDFISPAVFHNSKAIISVYTNALDPILSRDLKNFLKEHWNVFLSYRNRLQKGIS